MRLHRPERQAETSVTSQVVAGKFNKTVASQSDLLGRLLIDAWFGHLALAHAVIMYSQKRNQLASRQTFQPVDLVPRKSSTPAERYVGIPGS